MKTLKIGVISNHATTPISIIEQKVNEWHENKQGDERKGYPRITIVDIKVAGADKKIFVFIIYKEGY